MAGRGRQDALSTDPGRTLIYCFGPDFRKPLESEKCRDPHRGIFSIFLDEPTPLATDFTLSCDGNPSEKSLRDMRSVIID